MDIKQQDKRDISKVFTLLRNKLNGKEKELLELQRAQPCLLAPDEQQIDTMIDAISSLHLSTQDGSFIFPSNTIESSSNATTTTVCSTGVDSIKTLPNTTWLPEPKPEQENELRLPMVTHLLSLPFNAFVKSSSSNTPAPSPTPTLVEKNDEPPNRLPMVSQLFSMPINAFRTSSSSDNNQPLPIAIEEKQQTVNTKVTPSTTTTTAPKSIFESETIYSKEHWLKKSSPSESESESESGFVHLDLDEYIEQSSEKMRRLHLEYREALGKLNAPLNPADSTQNLKSMYPQMFERINQDMSPQTLNRLLPSKK